MRGPVLRALIADDEELARRRIADLLAGTREAEVVGQAATGTAAVRAVRDLAPDLLFLDVQMPGLDGFEALAMLEPDERPTVIFTTAYDEYALAAFDVHAVDYLLKPFSDERFESALRRAVEALRGQRARDAHHRVRALLEDLGLEPPAWEAAESRSSTRPLERFAVPDGERNRIVEASDVDWVEAARDYVVLHAAGSRHLVRATMAALEARLDPARFLRIHRGTIVNLSRVAHVQTDAHGAYLVVLKTGDRLRVGRSYSAVALERLGMKW